MTDMTPKTHKDWLHQAEKLSPRRQAFIDGAFTDAASGETFDCVNPATGKSLASVAACDSEDVNRAVTSARRAFNAGAWSGAAPEERKKVLLRLAELISEHIPEFALLDSMDMGKLITDAAAFDAPGAAEIFRWYGEAIDKVYDEIAPTGRGDLALVRREALGVVGAVVPWNYPLDMATWKCAPALAMGNSVVLKPAEQSPLSALRLAELAMEAGLPEGVLNVVPGFGETAGKAIGLHNDIDCVAFTGSTEVGKLFLQYSGQSNMKRIWLECGGKSPNLVFADCADLDAAAACAAEAVFGNQGEVCSANSRLLVQRGIKDALLEKLTAHARDTQPGDPLNPDSRMGAMVDETQTQRVMDYIAIGKDSARLVEGGEQVTINGQKNFIRPTIFDDVTNDQKIAREEIFGPVVCVMSFDEEEEAVAIANDTVYGLAASLWTNDLSRAHRVAERLQAGTVSVNTVDATSVVAPFGGMKQSGIGSDLSLHALDKYGVLKTTWIKY